MAQGGSGDVIIRIRSDSRDFQADVERARAQLNRLAGSANQASAGLRDGADAFSKMKSAMADTAVYGSSAALLMGLAGIPGKVREAADSYTDIQSKLKLATSSANELAVANERLFAMSQANRASFADTVQLYSGIALPLKEAGKSQEEILKFTDLVGKGLQVSGSSAGEAASTVRQLSQAMASGVLRGDEFNSIMENGKSVAMALADGLGTTTGKLRDMAEKGMLNSELVFNALMSQTDKMNQKFASIAPTMEKVWVTISNAAIKEIGKIDQATGASEAIAKHLTVAANNMEAIFSGAAVSATLLASVIGWRATMAITAYAASKLQAAGAARALALADAQALQISTAAAVRSAEATLIEATARERRIVAQRADAIASLAAARGTDGYAAAVARLNAAHVANAEAQAASAAARAELTAATAAATAATTRLTAAQAANTVAGRAAAAASSTGAGALRLIGGPTGLAMLAGVGLYYYAESANEAAKSITLANGQTLAFGEVLEHVTELSNEYRTASTSRQTAIREEIDNIIKLTNTRKIEAQQQLEYLNQLDAETAKGGKFEGNMFRAGVNQIRGWWADLHGLDQSEARAAIKEANATIAELTKQQKNLGKSAEELAGELNKTPEAYKAEAQAALAATDATKKHAASTVEAGKVLHGHGDNIKSLIEGLQQQRIELEHGKAAADYYAKRLQGLTDAEARAAVGASQYNTYLAELKKLNTEAAKAAGGLRDKYIAHLDEIGLGADAANEGINAAKSATDKMVDASDRYKISIDSATEALKRQADAAKAVLEAASNPVVPDAAGVIAAGTVAPSTGGKADGKLKSQMALAMKLNPATMAAINSTAQASGLDPVLMKAIAWIESRFNAKAYNKTSKASGIYQFVPGTAAQYGLTGKQFDPVANTQAYVRLLNDNMASLKKYGLEVNAVNLYLAHQQGVNGLRQIINEAKGYGRVEPQIRENMKGNPSGLAKDDSAAEFLRGWREKFAMIEDGVRSVPFKAWVQGLADEASKIAPAAAKAVPIWNELNAKTQKIADVAVEYGGAIDRARVSQKQINQLADDYMSGQADELVKAADEQLRKVQMTTAEYRAWQLQQDQFNAGEQRRILYAERQAEFMKEQIALNKELLGIRNPGTASQYAEGLSDKNLSKDKIKELTRLKMEIVFEGKMKELDGRAEQANLTAEAYQRLTMSRDGFTAAQINGMVAWGKEVAKMEETAEVNKRFADAFESDLSNALKSGELNFKGFADTVISEITRLQVVKPLMDSLFGDSGKGGLLGSLTSMLGFKDGGAFAGGVQMYANGGAFHNTVLHKPTQFFANGGLAVAGEAGAEAVMPLTRIGGKLGVMAVGGGNTVTVRPQFNISVINNAGAKIETQQQTDASGAINMTIMVDQIESAISDRARRGQGLANVFKRVG